MFRPFLASASVVSVVAFGCFSLAGCRQANPCQDGSCSVPSGGHNATAYSQPSYQGSGTVPRSPTYSAPAPSYSAPGYSAPGFSAPTGSGTR